MAIVDAIGAGDAEAARAAMEYVIVDGRAHVLKAFEAQGKA
jgi:DNA-binding FadR family transcriptional regulator